jgi:polyisoprenoid-binding protein YceI
MGARTWSIDPAHSQVEFGVKHMMFTTVRGQFSDFEGTIAFDPEDPSASAVEVNIEAASIDTGVEDRDNHLRSGDFFDVEQFPTISFRSTSVTGPITEAGSFTIKGELTIRGEQRTVELEGTFDGTGTDPWGGTRAGFSASAKIDRRDFGLTWNQALETGGVLVGHEVSISLQVQGVLQEEMAAV